LGADDDDEDGDGADAVESEPGLGWNGCHFPSACTVCWLELSLWALVARRGTTEKAHTKAAHVIASLLMVLKLRM
jgi:hypothetical protein